MLYIIDTKTTPPVVVLQVREDIGTAAEHVATAQRYADQTSHVLVVAVGPDAVLAPLAVNVIHPTAHAPAPAQQQLPVQGLNLAPVHAAPLTLGAAGSLWTWIEGEVKQLEPAAKAVLGPLLQRLLQQLIDKV